MQIQPSFVVISLIRNLKVQIYFITTDRMKKT